MMSDFVTWPNLAHRLKKDLQPGKHVAVIAPTGGGKTTLSIEGLIPYYKDVLVVDSTGDPNPPMLEYGKPYNRFGRIQGHRKLTIDSIDSKSIAVIWKAINRAFTQGNCAIYIDEVRQIADKQYFGLQKTLEYVWLFGRKRGVTLVGVTQAPRFVPSAFYDQSQAHFIFAMRDRRAQKRLAEISGDVDTLELIIPNLVKEKYEFAYVNPAGDVVRSAFVRPK